MSPKKLLLVLGLALIALFALFPPFRIVSLKDRQAAAAQAAFDPKAFADAFWTDTLLPAADQATSLDALLPALASDPETARERYARSVGLSNTHYYFVRGSATVTQKTEYKLVLDLLADSSRPATIEAPPVFGNTLRDATGLLDVNDFPNSQRFNLISAVLNEKAESLLNTLWSSIQVGDTISLVGCIEVVDPDRHLNPLRIVPVIAEKQ